MSGPSSEAIAAAQHFWTDRTGEPVSEDDAREAIANTAALFDLLAAWEGAESPITEPHDGDA